LPLAAAATIARMKSRAEALVALLQLQPHPEGGHFREVFRSPASVQPGDGRPVRSALTTIDFLLARGERSAWHRVRSDEVWHLLEGGPLRLWLMAPSLDAVHAATLGALDAQGTAPRHVVSAGWWQAAEPLGDYAWVGATVGPGFDFADFDFLRDDPAASARLAALRPDLVHLCAASLARPPAT
jgi:predicted cupin superfamily sugar epimerase